MNPLSPASTPVPRLDQKSMIRRIIPGIVSKAVSRAVSRVVFRTTGAILASALSGAVIAALVAPAALQAQAARPGLISQAVNESERVTLAGNTHPLATRAADRGVVPPSTPADRMLLLLRRSQENELTLRSTIEALHNPNSPSFHKWLTPVQFGAQFGAADSDIAAVTAWLQAHGFKVQGATAGRSAIEFSGTAGQVQEAFHTAIHTYQVDGEMHHANASDPQIPAALAPVVAGISTLNDFHPRAAAKKGPRGIYDLNAKKASPALTSSGTLGDFLYVGPADAATIYNSPIKALNPAATGATVDGSGATIAIIGDSNIAISQNANYRKLFGLAAKAPTVIVDGGVTPGINGDAVEAYLDTEVANGIAPGAKVYFYTAADTAVDYGLDLAILRAVNDNIADVLSLSFGQCEGSLGTSGNQFYESTWEQAAAQGISVTVSTGDSGSAGCDNENTQTVATFGLQVNGLASTAFNIAVGGTDFAPLAGPDGSGKDFTKYVSPANDPKTLRSALGYISEVPWNDSIASFPPGTIGTTIPFPDPNMNIVAAGGGFSNCSDGGLNGSGGLDCRSGYPKPSWQSAPGVPADHARDLPDVSLFAANGLYYAAWGICTDQDTDAAGNPVHDCTPGSDGLPPNQFYVYGVGGTSASAPAFAGILALVKQSTGERQGQADYVLYNLARNAPSIFHDVTTGNNAVPCQVGSLNCGANTVGANLLTGYNAQAGFDRASGLGSVDVSALISNWSSAGLASTTTQLAIAPTSVQHGLPVSVTATVTSAGGTPAGDVALTGSANPPSVPLARSIGTFPLSASGVAQESLNNLPGGSYKVTASYGGSAEFSQSVSAPVSVDITAEPSKTQIFVSAFNPVSGQQLNSDIPYGFYQGFSARPYGVNSPVVGGVPQPDGIATGTVAFSANAVNLGTIPLGSNGLAEVIGQMLSPGNYTLKAAYSGDPSFEPNVHTQPLTVVKGSTSLKMTASATRNTGKPITFTVALTTLSVGAAPTGTVALMSGTTVLAQTALVGTAATGTDLAAGTATIVTANLSNITSEVRAVYLGDANYGASTSNQIVVQGRPYFSLSNAALSLSSEHSTGAVVVPVTSKGGYAGTVKLTCVLVSGTASKAPPQCGWNPGSISVKADGVVGPVLLIYGAGTKLPSGITAGSNAKWMGTGGAILAACLLFGIPARRRGWRAMLAAVLLLVAVGGFSACVSTPKTISAGDYTFQVTGTDSSDATLTSSATVTVRVL